MSVNASASAAVADRPLTPDSQQRLGQYTQLAMLALLVAIPVEAAPPLPPAVVHIPPAEPPAAPEVEAPPPSCCERWADFFWSILETIQNLGREDIPDENPPAH
jgi:hypothetical protein